MWNKVFLLFWKVSSSNSFLIIVFPKVEYWIHSDDDDDDDSDDGIRKKVLVTGPQGRADVTNLQPDTAYRAWVSVENKYFLGPPSPTLAFTTAEGGQCWDVISEKDTKLTVYILSKLKIDNPE